MAPPSKSGMELNAMKLLLNKAAPESPVPFAFGQGAEPAFALLMLDKVGKNPKAVLKDLEESFKDAKNTRWGTAVVEPANDKLVKFIVNKAVSGMAKRLVKTMKGTGYNRAEIVLEDGTVVEGASEEEDEGAPVVVAPGVGVPPPPPPMPTRTPGPDLAELKGQLGKLIPRIAVVGGTNAELVAQLSKMAREAGALLGTGNLVLAAAAISSLRIALDNGGVGGPHAGSVPPPPPPPPTGPTAGYAKPRQDWLAAHTTITGGIEQLRAELVSTYQAEGIAADVEKRYKEVVGPLLSTLDDSLLAKLDAAGDATDPAVRTKLVGEARAIMTRYAGALTNPVIADLDSNPFVKLSLRATLASTLKELSASVR